MGESFSRYNPNTPPEERKGSPVCVASYPEPCGERAVGEGWGCLPLCEKHWNEAGLAAREELSYAVESELNALVGAEKPRRPQCRRGAGGAVRRRRARLGAGRPRPLTLGASGGLFDGEARGPHRPRDARLRLRQVRRRRARGVVEDARLLLLRFLRQAGETGLPGLALDLERLRERATVQQILAERDCERRYLAPSRAAR